MYSNFKEQAIENVKQAVQEDNAGNYSKAFTLYMNALEYFKTHLKYEKNPEIHEAIRQKFNEYLHRAEELRAVLDQDGPGLGSSSGDSAVVVRPKSKPKDWEDPEQARPSTNFFKEQAIEYVKQAVREDNARNYSKALPLYMNALEYFKVHLKYEKNAEIREAITQKFNEYLCRAEELRTVLDEGRTGLGSGGGGSAVVERPKTKPKDGEGAADGQDLEQARPSINSTFEVEDMKRNSFKEQGIEYVKQALQEDEAGNYSKAFPLYMNALEYFRTDLKYEKNPMIREAITQKFNEYLHRAEEIHAVLNEGGPMPGSSGGDLEVVARPMTKPKERESGGDGEHKEQVKLGARSNTCDY